MDLFLYVPFSLFQKFSRFWIDLYFGKPQISNDTDTILSFPILKRITDAAVSSSSFLFVHEVHKAL